MGAPSGALLVLCAMAIMGLIDVFVVEIAELGGLWQFHATRAAMAVPMLLVLGRVLRQPVWPLRFWTVAARSLLFAAAMFLYFGSIPMMPIAFAVAGMFTSPAFVLLFSVLIFGLRVGPARIAAVTFGFIGVLIVLDPGGARFEPALLMPVAAGALYAMSAITARQWCQEESTIAMLMVFFLTLGAVGGIGLIVLGRADHDLFVLRGWVPLSGEFLFWCFVQATGSIIAVGMLTRAYQQNQASQLVVFEYALLIFASFWGFVIYGQTVGPVAMTGMALILACGIIIARRSQ